MSTKNFYIFIFLFIFLSCSKSSDKKIQNAQEQSAYNLGFGKISVFFQGQNINYYDGLINIESIRLMQADGSDVEILTKLPLNLANLTDEPSLIKQSIEVPVGIYTRALITLGGSPVLTYKDGDSLVTGRVISPTGRTLGSEIDFLPINVPISNGFVDVEQDKESHFLINLPMNAFIKPLKPEVSQTLTAEDGKKPVQNWFFEMRLNIPVEGGNFKALTHFNFMGKYQSATDSEILVTTFQNQEVRIKLKSNTAFYKSTNNASLGDLVVGDYIEIKGGYVQQQDIYVPVAQNITFYENKNLFKGTVTASDNGSMTILGNDIIAGHLHQPNEEVTFKNDNIQKTNLYSTLMQPYFSANTPGVQQGPSILKAAGREIEVTPVEVEAAEVIPDEYRFIINNTSTICGQLKSTVLDEASSADSSETAALDSSNNKSITAYDHLVLENIEIVTSGNQLIPFDLRDAKIYMKATSTLIAELESNCDDPGLFSEKIVSAGSEEGASETEFLPRLVKLNLKSLNQEYYVVVNQSGDSYELFDSKDNVNNKLQTESIQNVQSLTFDHYAHTSWKTDGILRFGTSSESFTEPQLNINDPIFFQVDNLAFSLFSDDNLVAAKFVGLKTSKPLTFYLGEKAISCNYIPMQLPKRTSDEIPERPTLVSFEMVTENAANDAKIRERADRTPFRTNDDIDDIVALYDLPTYGGSSNILSLEELALWLETIQKQQEGNAVRFFEVNIQAQQKSGTSGSECNHYDPLEVYVRFVKGDTILSELNKKLALYKLANSGVIIGATVGITGIVLAALAAAAYKSAASLNSVLAASGDNSASIQILDSYRIKLANTFLTESRLIALAQNVANKINFTDESVVDEFRKRFNQLVFPEDFFSTEVSGKDLSQTIKDNFDRVLGTEKIAKDLDYNISKSYNPSRKIPIPPVKSLSVKPLTNVTPTPTVSKPISKPRTRL